MRSDAIRSWKLSTAVFLFFLAFIAPIVILGMCYSQHLSAVLIVIKPSINYRYHHQVTIHHYCFLLQPSSSLKSLLAVRLHCICYKVVFCKMHLGHDKMIFFFFDKWIMIKWIRSTYVFKLLLGLFFLFRIIDISPLSVGPVQCQINGSVQFKLVHHDFNIVSTYWTIPNISYWTNPEVAVSNHI